MKDISLCNNVPGPIGIFDSGYGGLTIYREIQELLPQYNYLYLGDNARTPYGTRSFDVVYEFTRQCVKYLFSQGCHLVILACNTASAKALRSIQQVDLPAISLQKRVLGIIRPTVETIGDVTRSRHVGVLATEGTIKSNSYPLEIHKLFPDIVVTGEACPMWVPLVETSEHKSPGADYFIKRHVDNLLSRDSQIDTIILGCTHYPMLIEKIKQYVPQGVRVLTQGAAVAASLKDYLARHPEMDALCAKDGKRVFCTTESDSRFCEQASRFLEQQIDVMHVTLD
ncbi:MAG: glutamate racemase [Bacteroidaceae bacterium]|nr:glutamate racemase [Bacteroidaceae bacterium]